MVRWTAMMGMALLIAGCAADDFEEGEEGQEGAATESPGEPGEAENVGEAAQAVAIGSYSASNTNSALNEAAVTKFSFTIGGNRAVMIGTDGISGASNVGNTVLRLFGPTGDHVTGNHDYLCSPDLGSRMYYKSPYDETRTFTLWAGCFGDESCGPNKVAISRRKLLFDFTADNTNNAKKNITKDGANFTAGQKIRVSTCGVVAAGADYKGDTFLRLYRKDGGTYLYVAGNDDTNLCDANCGQASSILYDVPSDGYYEVRAGCFENTKCSGTVAVYAE